MRRMGDHPAADGVKEWRVVRQRVGGIWRRWVVGMAGCLTLGTGEVMAGEGANHPTGFVKPIPAVTIPLWPDGVPGYVAGGREEVVVNERFRNVSVPLLMVYPAPKEKATGASLLICAGGGYGGLAMCVHVENVVECLHARGITVVGVKYRTSYGKNDVLADAVADGERAVRLVRSHAAEWGLDPGRVGMQGYSAGANLVLNLMSQYDPGDPKAEDPVGRFSSRPDFCVLMSPWPYRQKIEEIAIRGDAPPTWIATALDDTTAPSSFAEAIGGALRARGVPAVMHVVEKGGHGAFHYGLAQGEGARWPEFFFKWMEERGVIR